MQKKNKKNNTSTVGLITYMCILVCYKIEAQNKTCKAYKISGLVMNMDSAQSLLSCSYWYTLPMIK